MGVDSEHSARGYAAGAVDYISKPFDPWALRAKVAVFTSIPLSGAPSSEVAALRESPDHGIRRPVPAGRPSHQGTLTALSVSQGLLDSRHA